MKPRAVIRSVFGAREMEILEKSTPESCIGRVVRGVETVFAGDSSFVSMDTSLFLGDFTKEIRSSSSIEKELWD